VRTAHTGTTIDISSTIDSGAITSTGNVDAVSFTSTGDVSGGTLTTTGGVIMALKTVGPTSTGTIGEMAHDDNYIYTCIFTDTWVRTSNGSTFTLDPGTISGLQAHYDASNTGSMEAGPADVNLWFDLTANTHDLITQGGSTVGTGYSTQNSLNVVDFVSGDRIGNAGSLIDYGSHTIIMVLKITSNDDGGLYDVFGTGSTVDGDVLWRLQDADPGVGIDHTIRTRFYRGAGANIVESSVSQGTGWRITVQRANGGTNAQDVIVDGTIDTRTATGVVSSTNRGVFLFSRDSANRNTAGSIAEVLIYDEALTDNDLNAVGKHLATKWDVSWTDI
jgi:hypothetical protein